MGGQSFALRCRRKSESSLQDKQPREAVQGLGQGVRPGGFCGSAGKTETKS